MLPRRPGGAGARGMIASIAQRYGRLLRYLVVGAGTTGFYSLLMIALHTSGWVRDPTLAAAAAYIATQPLAFYVHSRTTYADVARARLQLTRFLIVAGVMFLVTTVTMKLVDMAGWPFWIGLAIGYVLGPLVTYIINALWVFRTKKLLELDR
jgi:putative flippase GtrA